MTHVIKHRGQNGLALRVLRLPHVPTHVGAREDHHLIQNREGEELVPALQSVGDEHVLAQPAAPRAPSMPGFSRRRRRALCAGAGSNRRGPQAPLESTGDSRPVGPRPACRGHRGRRGRHGDGRLPRGLHRPPDCRSGSAFAACRARDPPQLCSSRTAPRWCSAQPRTDGTTPENATKRSEGTRPSRSAVSTRDLPAHQFA